MAECILLSSGGNSADLDAITATAADIVAGKVAVDKDGELLTGTMINQGDWNSTELAAGSSVTIPAGKHSGGGKVSAKSLASQTGGATATDPYVKNGLTYWKDGVKRTGTMVVSSVVSFSVAPYSTSQVVATWKNPSKGPYSGIAICAKTGSYPTSIHDSRKYTGVGSNSVPNGSSSVTIGGFTAGTTYYFRIWTYCTVSSGDLYSSGYLQATATPTAHGRRSFTASGTFTIPAGVRSIDVHCTGGGGAGSYGSSSSASGSGNGGGGGYTAYKNGIAVSPGQVIQVTVGNGGSGNGANGSESYATINGAKTVSALGGVCGNSPKGGSGGGAGGYNSYVGTSGAGGAGGTNGDNGGATRRPNNQGWGNPGSAKGGTGQGSTTKEFGTGTVYSGGGGGAGGGMGSDDNTGQTLMSPGGAGGAGGGGKGGDGKYSRVGGTDGTAATGGGGGGCHYNAGGNATVGKGGSGNVIIKW